MRGKKKGRKNGGLNEAGWKWKLGMVRIGWDG